MKKTNKVFIGIGIFLVIAVVVIFGLNYYLENQIRNNLDTALNSSAATLDYDDISVNVLSGNASLENIVYQSDKYQIAAEGIQLNNLNYSDYIFNGKYVVDEILINNPKVKIRKKSDTVATGDSSGGQEKFEEEIRVKKFRVIGGSLTMVQQDTTANEMFLSLENLEVLEVVANEATLNKAVPFKYEQVNISSDSVFYNLNAEHTIGAGNWSLKEGTVQVSDLRIVPKYPRAEFDRVIPYEKDRIELLIKSLDLQGFNFNAEQDSLLLSSGVLNIEGANLEIYRNKLLADDTRIKPLYSKMIRELGVKLQLDSIKVKELDITYEENVLEDRPPGKINFTGAEATIFNISNVGMDSPDFKETEVRAEAMFMGETPVTLDWTFDISNTRDEFQAQGKMEGIRAEAINPFLRPAMSVEAEGTIESLFYNFYGNNHEAAGDMQLAYRNFKVSILKDGEQEEKSFLSGLANLFLKNDAVNEDVEQEDIRVERNKMRSFWNYLWLCIRDGAMETFI